MVAVDAVSWIIPNQPAGRPIQSRSQPIVTCSSSVAAGDVFQTMPLPFSAAASISPSIPGPGALLAK
jgi:hypothetical protein